MVAGTKRPFVHHTCVKDCRLPTWFTSHTKGNFSCNTSMPSLKYIREMLVDYLGTSEDLYVARCGGVYCPVHLYSNRKYVHGSNGVYIGYKVKSIRSIYKLPVVVRI